MVVQSRKGAAGIRELRLRFSSADVQTVPFDAEQAVLAHRAFSEFGEGRHKAAPIFGDCFGYSLSESTGEPLLFKGNDFSETDIAPAMEP